jgi:hypothetical protein
MNRLFTLGDTHGAPDVPELVELFPEQYNLTKDDVVAQMGDFGYVMYKMNENRTQEFMLDFLASRSYTLVVVPGNHENYDEINNFPLIEKWGGKVRVLDREGEGQIFFLERGEIYTICGKKIFVFGGALSIDKDSRILGLDFWEEEMATYKEFENAMVNLEKHNWEVDLVFSHTCPTSIIEDIIFRTPYTEGKFKDGIADFFDVIYKDKKLKFSEWHFGHFHTDVRVDFSNTDDGIFHCHFGTKPYEIV